MHRYDATLTIRQLLNDCDLTIGESEQLHNALMSQLSQLDADNMRAIMGSEEQVLKLMRVIDAALDRASDLDERLEKLDGALVVSQFIRLGNQFSVLVLVRFRAALGRL